MVTYSPAMGFATSSLEKNPPDYRARWTTVEWGHARPLRELVLLLCAMCQV